MTAKYSCSCGATFRTYSAEARHRHNFPLLCRKPKPKPQTYGVKCTDCGWHGRRMVPQGSAAWAERDCPRCGGKCVNRG